MALKYAKLAEIEIAAFNYFRAGNFLQDAKGYIELNSVDQLRNPTDRDVHAYFRYVLGSFLASSGELQKGYDTVIDSFKQEPKDVTPEFAITAGNREFSLGWICLKLRRPVESAIWYQKSLELGHPHAANRLGQVCKEHPTADRVLTSETQALVAKAIKAAGGKDAAPSAGKIAFQATGKLSSTDPMDKVLTKSYHQVHTFKMTAGDTYTIDLESREFDTYLRLEDSAGNQLAKDDDSGGDLNARIVHKASKDDTVRIIVTSYKGGITGSYTLTIRHRPPGYQFDKSGKLIPPSPDELLAADANSSIIVLDRGKLKSGNPYWAYVAVKPSKYAEFMRKAKAARNHTPRGLRQGPGTRIR